MRVAIINNAWAETSVGMYIFELFSRFKKMKKDIEMVYFQSKFPLTFHDKKIKIIKSPLKFPLWEATLNNFLYFPKKVPSGYDVYHISNQTIANCCKFAKPSVVTCHDIFTYTAPDDYDLFTNFLLKKHLDAMKKASKIIVPSKWTKNDLIKVLNIPENKIEVVYHGVNRERFRPRNKISARKKLGLPIDKKLILFVGLDLPRKNIRTILKTLYKLRKNIKNLKLILITKIRKETRELVNNLGLQNHIQLVDWVPSNLLPFYYNSVDLFIFPSYYEGFGLPVLEAMASGVPVITSNGTSLPEIIGSTSIMISPLNVKMLAEEALKLLTNTSIQKTIIKKQLKRSKMFSWRTSALKTWKIYEEVLQ